MADWIITVTDTHRVTVDEDARQRFEVEAELDYYNSLDWDLDAQVAQWLFDIGESEVTDTDYDDPWEA